ncbi:MAG: hypothetical protein EB162_05645 [Euryarchaeota archaeon]|nr:hypothetical protein [Euryarchaeota archaeon]NDB94439.1 hypothetical protein [Euryarchaeota archaeon]NDG22121.1 hypothetical protein [Euryarchaeota archaeon]
MRNLPQFRVGCWPLTLDDESKRTDKTPTHTGNVEWNGTKLPVVAWFREDPGMGKNGKPLPNISIQLDRQKLEYNYTVPSEDLQGENIVDNPHNMPRGEIDRLDRMEQALAVVLDAMLRRDEQEQIEAEAEIATKH